MIDSASESSVDSQRLQSTDLMFPQITINLPKDNIPLSDFERMGKQLTIERTIQKAGQASFRILDARGKSR
jgi:hypothetical protein